MFQKLNNNLIVILCLLNIITEELGLYFMSLFLFHFSSNSFLLYFIKVLVHDGFGENELSLQIV